MTMGFRIVAVSALLLGGLGVASAQDDPIGQRRAILKGFGEATKPIAGMLKGETPFDNASVQKALATYAEGAKKLPGLFPDNSRTGGETAALPKIWDDKAKFVGIYGKLGADATAASAAITDETSFKANIGKVLGNCKACHDDYRAKKN